MAGNAKRITKKLKALELAFTELPIKHRTRSVWTAMAKMSGVKPERAADHVRLALCLLEAAPAVAVAGVAVARCFEDQS